MTTAKQRLEVALRDPSLQRPTNATQPQKKRYSEKLSEALAQGFAAELRERGMTGARPAPPGALGPSGAERRMAGGIGAKKVDVTWATEESGLVLAISVKTISWKDGRTQNYQKNLTNRRGEMVFEAITLHKRFPFASLIGVMVFPGGPDGADADQTARRKSTFQNAHTALRLFTGRDGYEDRDEQYERFYICLHEASPISPKLTWYEAGDPSTPIDVGDVFAEMAETVVLRNSDLYEIRAGKICKR